VFVNEVAVPYQIMKAWLAKVADPAAICTTKEWPIVLKNSAPENRPPTRVLCFGKFCSKLDLRALSCTIFPGKNGMLTDRMSISTQ
jgi:hypothetical protein